MSTAPIPDPKKCTAKVSQEPITEAELHSNFSQYDRNHLAPSFFYTFFSCATALFSPIGLVCGTFFGLTALLLAGEMIFVEMNHEAKALVTTAVETPVEKEALESVEEETNPDSVALVAQQNFISGIIAVRRPSHKNGGEIAQAIVEVAEELQADPIYVAAVISAESGFSPVARSHKNAIGLMQLLPTTAKEVYERLEGKKSYPRLKDPHTNIRLGITYLKQLEQHYRGDKFLALAAYNWGPGNVDKHRQGLKSMPRSVKRYADTILSSTKLWTKHYKVAEKAQA